MKSDQKIKRLKDKKAKIGTDEGWGHLIDYWRNGRSPVTWKPGAAPAHMLFYLLISSQYISSNIQLSKYQNIQISQYPNIHRSPVTWKPGTAPRTHAPLSFYCLIVWYVNLFNFLSSVIWKPGASCIHASLSFYRWEISSKYVCFKFHISYIHTIS